MKRAFTLLLSVLTIGDVFGFLPIREWAGKVREVGGKEALDNEIDRIEADRDYFIRRRLLERAGMATDAYIRARQQLEERHKREMAQINARADERRLALKLEIFGERSAEPAFLKLITDPDTTYLAVSELKERIDHELSERDKELVALRAQITFPSLPGDSANADELMNYLTFLRDLSAIFYTAAPWRKPLMEPRASALRKLSPEKVTRPRGVHFAPEVEVGRTIGHEGLVGTVEKIPAVGVHYSPGFGWRGTLSKEKRMRAHRQADRRAAEDRMKRDQQERILARQREALRAHMQRIMMLFPIYYSSKKVRTGK